MPWMKDGQELWNFIRPYKPVLLTTPAVSVKDCKDDKIDWKNKNLSEDVLIIFSDSKEVRIKDISVWNSCLNDDEVLLIN